MCEDERIKVLLVDDEEGFRGPLAKRLIRRKFIVNQAGDGVEALDSLKREPVHVVVLDVKMPEMDGLETLDRIMAQDVGTEVILLTAHISAREGVAGISAGAFDYLAKPVDIGRLTGKIQLAYEKTKRTRALALEAEIKSEKARQALTAEKLTELGALAQGAAIEMNAPLDRISEAAALLTGCLGDSDLPPYHVKANIQEALWRLEEAVLKARSITSRLSAFTRGDDSLIKEFDLMEILRDVVELTRKAASKNRNTVKITAPLGPLPIKTDPYKLRQVLKNLAQAGLRKDGESGHEIEFLVQTEMERTVIHLKNLDPGRKAERTGPGSQSSTHSDNAPGTGLGLSEAKVAIEKIGGRLETENPFSTGAWVKITLPNADAARSLQTA